MDGRQQEVEEVGMVQPLAEVRVPMVQRHLVVVEAACEEACPYRVEVEASCPMEEVAAPNREAVGEAPTSGVAEDGASQTLVEVEEAEWA